MREKTGTGLQTGFKFQVGVAFQLYSSKCNLVPRACDPREGTRGSGIIRFREESDWPLKWNA